MPDLSPATNLATNVIPRTPTSYGPLPSLSEYSTNALDNTCLGAVSIQDTDLTIRVVSGTADKLYMINSSTPTWADVSGTSYSTAAGDNWRFALFERTIVATNFGNPIQSYNMASSTTFGTMASAAPQARHICTPKNFCMVGNTYDPVGGLAPGRIWWSGAGDNTNWPTPGSAAAQEVMSDYNDFPGNQGQINGMVGNLASSDVGIFFLHAIWRGVFVGPPDVFDFFPSENARGCPAPNSIIQVGLVAYFLGEDGFYSFDGTQSTPIGGDQVDYFFYSKVNKGALYNVIGAADVQNKMAVWIFPSTSSVAPDSMLLWRWDIGRWSFAQMGAQWIARFMSFGVSMDGMPALGFTDVDTLPASLDSSVWIGGALQLGAVDLSRKLAFFNGPNLQATIGTQAIQITPGRRSFVQGARPITDATAATIAISARQNLFDGETFSANVAVNAMGECPQRSSGRYHRARITIPAGSVWTEASGVDVTAIPEGWR